MKNTMLKTCDSITIIGIISALFGMLICSFAICATGVAVGAFAALLSECQEDII